MSPLTSASVCPGYEPIEGYILEQQIGQGGFGEVWRATAPGGMKKAVKFVSGIDDRTRGSRELKSLERIKGVQHPFLLTLERFGVVDDRLVIVTELADGSLEDVYRRHRDRGSCGIPRDTLLGFLHDAADALDYLHERYQLQHLDIKPGNLLIVGEHVKVGDFGLLKDLREVECSVVGGLTPIYAPPELFDGRPTLHSDQYSLAVMFQELLTGTRPFAGRTIAQLATQHIHGTPNLVPLPAADRPIVARTLEKKPDRRFPNCRAFVEALRSPRGAGAKKNGDGTELEGRFGDATTEADTSRNVVGDGTTGAMPVADLPQLSGSSGVSSSDAVSHALIVGLGGTGARCLAQLRRRAEARGKRSSLDLHSLLIDTDIETIQIASADVGTETLPACRTLHVPLRTVQDYRQTGTGRFRTVSRRWIYNVPRSRTTEGMRPLGRLALVDAGPEVVRQLNRSVTELADACGGDVPRVYLLGSLSGGTGGGTFFDVVYLLRHVLDGAGLEHADVIPLMSSVPLRGNPTDPLSLHDTIAAIKELGHFMRPGNSYPGDLGAEWPGLPAARSPLGDAYLIAGGASGTPHPNPVGTMTEYVWADATGAGDLLSAARSSGPEIVASESREITIRSVGVIRLQSEGLSEKYSLTPAIARHLLIDWLGRPREAKEVAPQLASLLARRCHVDPQASRHETPCREIMTRLRRELARRLQDRRVDVTTAIQAVEMLGDRVRGRGDVTPDARATDAEEATATHPDLDADSANYPLAVNLDRFASRLKAIAVRIARAIREATDEKGVEENPWDEMSESLRGLFEPTLVRLHGDLAATWLVGALEDDRLESCTDPGPMWRAMTDQALPLVREAIAEAEGESVRPGTTESRLPATGAHAIRDLNRDAATEQTSNESATLTFRQPVRSDTITYDGPSTIAPIELEDERSLEDAVATVRPPLLECGGQQRLILLVGCQAERDELEPRLRAIHGGSLTVATVPGTSPLLIQEAQQIRLDEILRRLEEVSGRDPKVCQKLQSRTDIDWAT